MNYCIQTLSGIEFYMNWYEKNPERLTLARLLVSSPDTVYEELKKYSKFLKEDPIMYFDGFEKALFARDDRLINLGLAQFASKKDIILELYKHGCSSEDNLNPSDCIYYQGLRLACLANEVVGGTSGWLDDIQIKALIDKSSNDSWCEINTLRPLHEPSKNHIKMR